MHITRITVDTYQFLDQWRVNLGIHYQDPASELRGHETAATYYSVRTEDPRDVLFCCVEACLDLLRKAPSTESPF